MLWSATAQLAQRFSKTVRDLTGKVFPLDENVHGWQEWKLAGTGPNEGQFYAAGIGGGGTMGAGGHMLVIDDYHRSVEDALSETIRKKQQEWYLTGCLTRMEPGASLVVICTRWHRDDLVGFIQQHSREVGDDWHVISRPAIGDDGSALWPDRWPIGRLEQVRANYFKSGYPWMWEALYQQNPPEVLDSEWDPEYFGEHLMYEADREVEPRFRIMTLDPSVGNNEKSDYSAIVDLTVDRGGHCWIDADIGRRDGERQVQDVLDRCSQNTILTVGVEINAFQGVLRSMFARASRERQFYPHFHGIHSSTDKVMRIREAITPYLSRGLLHFRRGSPGVSLLLEQLRGFPSHRYKDGPDALAMAIKLAQHITQFGIEDVTEEGAYELASA